MQCDVPAVDRMYAPPPASQAVPMVDKGAADAQTAALLVDGVDVRIFFGNCPCYDADARIRAVVEPIGTVDRLDIMPSTLHNRRVSGFIHMSSIEAAEAAVEKLNGIKLGRRGAKLYANIKSCETVLRPAPVEREQHNGLGLGSLPPLIETDEGATSFGESVSMLAGMDDANGASAST